MRILFASGIDGFCHRYAVLHWAEQLATQNVGSTVRAHTDPRLAADLAHHDLVVLYRVPYSPWIAYLLAGARALGRATVFAVDDLIICPEVEDVPPLRRLDAEARQTWHDGVRRYRQTLLACDAFLATSGPLADAGRAAGHKTYLHRAGLGAYELALGEAAARAAPPRTELVRLGYFSGTPSHDDDFRTILPVLTALLECNPRVELLVGGHLASDSALARFGARVLRAPFVLWTELPPLIATTDVNLAPLEWRHPFAAAKGAVKYLEAAAVGVPTVASPSDAYRDAIRHGTTGMLAADAAEWRAALDTLVADREVRAGLGARARADVVARFNPAFQGKALAATFAEVAESGGRRSAAAAAGPLDEVALASRFPGEVARTAREPQGRPGFAALDCGATTPPLGDGVLLAQHFRATEDGLARVDVHTVTYEQLLDHTLDVHVRRDDGSALTAQTFAAVLAPDRGWFAVEFPPQWRSAGRLYVLELRAHGTGPGNALSFGATALPGPEGPFTLGSGAGAGSLTLRTFAAEEIGDGRSDAVADAC